jgi:transcriptional regulator with XRE-family HTH domain
MNSLPSIDLNIAERLKADPRFRQAYFLAESSGMIARQLIGLRKRRGLSQADVAKQLDTRQPAVSRVESADYRNWSFNTLRRLAEALDARLRVIIEPSEDILGEYEERREEAKPVAPPAQAFEFNRWLGESRPYPPPPHPRRSKIVEDVESATTSSEPTKQRPAPSLLDEEQVKKQRMPRQNIKAEMVGATWS